MKWTKALRKFNDDLTRENKKRIQEKQGIVRNSVTEAPNDAL